MKILRVNVKERMKLFNVAVPATVADALKAKAKEQGLTRKKLVELVLAQVLVDSKFVLEV